MTCPHTWQFTGALFYYGKTTVDLFCPCCFACKTVHVDNKTHWEQVKKETSYDGW